MHFITILTKLDFEQTYMIKGKDLLGVTNTIPSEVQWNWEID